MACLKKKRQQGRETVADAVFFTGCAHDKKTAEIGRSNLTIGKKVDTIKSRKP